MITTDQSTCLSGYAGIPAHQERNKTRYKYKGKAHNFYPFDAALNPLNSNCHYTNSFNGTSSAAPNTSGVVALIAQANPDLPWRDIKHILAKTADKTDPLNPQVQIPAGNGYFTAHQGWFKNAAGYEYNNFYGFGRVNAGNAVQLAKSYTQADRLPKARKSHWLRGPNTLQNGQLVTPAEIPDNNPVGVELIIPVADDITVETVQLRLDIQNSGFTGEAIANHLQRKYLKKQGKEIPWHLQLKSMGSTAGIDLAIEVTSPSGTKAVLLSSKQAILSPPVLDWEPEITFSDGFIMKDSLIGASAFYGESGKGDWKIRFYDTAADSISQENDTYTEYLNNVANSVVSKAILRVVGH
jgi:subtilisin-like proprotein convertase family protein